MKLKARVSLRREKGICPSELYNGVLAIYAFHLQKFCAGPKNKTQVGGSDRDYMQLVGVVVALHSEKYIPEGVRDGEGEFAIPLLIYNTMCILWMTKGLFEGNFDYS